MKRSPCKCCLLSCFLAFNLSSYAQSPDQVPALNDTSGGDSIQVDLDHILSGLDERQAAEAFTKDVTQAKKIYIKQRSENLVQNIDDGDTKRPFILALTDTESSIELPEVSGDVTVKIVNMVPDSRAQGLYSTQVRKAKSLPQAFSTPPVTPWASSDLSNLPPEGNDAVEALGEGAPQEAYNKLLEKHCEQLENAYVNVMSSQKESDVASNTSAYRVLASTGEFAICKDFVAYSKAVELSTSTLVRFNAESGYNYTVAVSREGIGRGNLAFKSPAKNWLTHYGLMFVKDRNKAYYTKKTETTDDEGATSTEYILTEQGDNREYIYGATALFTYPFVSSGDFKLGLSTGVGVSESNLMGYLGGSIVIHHNFVLTFGSTVQKFDVLRGNKTIGESFDAAITDNTELVESTYKWSPTIGLAYHFSGGD